MIQSGPPASSAVPPFPPCLRPFLARQAQADIVHAEGDREQDPRAPVHRIERIFVGCWAPDLDVGQPMRGSVELIDEIGMCIQLLT